MDRSWERCKEFLTPVGFGRPGLAGAHNIGGQLQERNDSPP